MQPSDESPSADWHEPAQAGHSHKDAGQTDKHHTSEYGYCQRCQQDVAVAMKRRFTGGRNGGMQSQAVCVSCGRVLQVS
jgi:ABC-type nickel/cobalt efflux system permease component RcnA